MTLPERIQVLMQELGPATEEIEAVQQIKDEPEWTVFFDEDTAVGLDLILEQEKLVLSMNLGAPPAEHRASTYELVLLYNYNWTDSGGAKIGLDAPEGELSLLFELNASELNLPTLQRVLMSFLQKAQAWRELVALGVRSGRTPEMRQASTEEMALGEFSGIRV